MPFAFNGTVPNLNYAVNQLNRRQTGILGTVGTIIAGAGAVATNYQIEQAVGWAINKAKSRKITYSQKNRNLKNVLGQSYDCSSFVITAFYSAGIDVPASATSDMKAGFTSKGWVWHPMSPSIPASVLQRGDILLAEGKHTQIYIGNNQDVNCGSTPAKVMNHVTKYSRGGWDGFLRYGA